MNLTFVLVVIVAWGLSLGGSYFYGRSDGKDIAKAEQTEVADAIRAAKEESRLGAAEAIAKIEVTHTVVKQRVEREVYEKPVYRECRHTPDGLQSVNAAITGNTESLGSGKLPRLDATK